MRPLVLDGIPKVYETDRNKSYTLCFYRYYRTGRLMEFELKQMILLLLGKSQEPSQLN